MMSEEELAIFLHNKASNILDWSVASPANKDKFLTLAKEVQILLEASDITLQERVRILEQHIESQDRMLVERTSRLEQALKERDTHKRIRKQITRQLKDVEKARKWEMEAYLQNFGIVKQVIFSLKDKIKSLEASKTSFWSKLFG